MISVNEIIITAVCIADILNEESQKSVCAAIDESFNKNKELQDFHKSNKFKNYCFDELRPFPNNGIYKRGAICTFTIRTADESLKEHFMRNLPGLQTFNLVLVTAENKVIRRGVLSKLDTISPLVIKTEVGYWRGTYDDEYFVERINSNIVKKYNAFTGKQIPLGSISPFELINFRKTKVKRKYKDIVLIGDHCSLKVKEDDLSQELAYFALAFGLCELNARGMGFMQYSYKR